MPPLCFCHFLFFLSLSLLFQVIIMGFVCVTVALVMQTERKSLYNKIWRSQITVFFFWVGVLQCVTAKTKLPKATKKKKINKKNKNDIKIPKKIIKKMLWRKNTKGNMWAENSAVLIFLSLSLSFYFSRRWIKLHRVSLDVRRALKRYL